MKILDMLKGENSEAEKKLQALKKRIGGDERLCWYPSAGSDFRDLFEFSFKKGFRYGVTELPNLFVHTDYWGEIAKFEVNTPKIKDYEIVDLIGERSRDYNLFPPDIAFKYKNRVTIKDIRRLKLKDNINIHLDLSRGATFRDVDYSEPEILLMEVEIKTKSYGIINAPVLFMYYENINFLEEFLLKHRVKITHMVKVREGCGCGGCSMSISFVYPFLPYLGVKYLYADWEIHFDPSNHSFYYELLSKYNIPLKYFILKTLKINRNWSDYKAKLFKIIPVEKEMSLREIYKILKSISDEYESYNNINLEAEEDSEIASLYNKYLGE